YDIQRKKCVLLKDSWCILLPDITPEGEVYAQLHRHSVPNVPHCSCTGNVDDDAYHKSRTHEFAGRYGQPHPLMQFIPHQHYCLVLDTIGQKLDNFKCSWEMMNVVHTLLIAHEAAYNIGVLHRDISVGNIMIVNNDEPNIKGRILINWDLSKLIILQDGSNSAHQYTCTGTWQFMVADLVQQSHTPHTFIHDLESAFWVILWIVFSH
ncbi:hypothetical protein BJY52DRAFT_1106829, partial [Lactarius psammicola]